MTCPRASFVNGLQRLALALVVACLFSKAATAQTQAREVPDLGPGTNTLEDARDIAASLSQAQGGPRPVHVIKIWELDETGSRTGNYDGRLITGQYPPADMLLTEGVAMHVTVQGPISEDGEAIDEQPATNEDPPCPSCTIWIVAFALAVIVIVLLLMFLRRP